MGCFRIFDPHSGIITWVKPRQLNVWSVKRLSKSHNSSFFTKGSTQDILMANYEVLPIDCTYKTNWYHMPLMIISRQTSLNSNFYIIFCFMAHETQINYAWVLFQLSNLYAQLRLSNLIIIVTDMKFALIAAIEKTFPTVTHLLCIWHINNNVLVQCRKYHESQEE